MINFENILLNMTRATFTLSCPPKKLKYEVFILFVG